MATSCYSSAMNENTDGGERLSTSARTLGPLNQLNGDESERGTGCEAGMRAGVLTDDLSPDCRWLYCGRGTLLRERNAEQQEWYLPAGQRPGVVAIAQRQRRDEDENVVESAEQWSEAMPVAPAASP